MPDHKLFQRLPIAPLIAVVGIVLSILLIPLRISRDTLNVTDRQLLANDQVALVHNLDDDPEPGLVRMKHNVLGQAALSIDDHNRGTLDQHNLKGRFRNMGGSTVVSDVDADGSADVMTLTMEADTLWLFVLYAAGKESRLASWPVDTLHGLDTFTDLSLQMFGPVDLDADGSREILFTANAGFSLHPRAVYALDPRNGKVTQSPELGNKVVVREVATEMDDPSFSFILPLSATIRTVGPDCMTTAHTYWYLTTACSSFSLPWSSVATASKSFHFPSWIKISPALPASMAIGLQEYDFLDSTTCKAAKSWKTALHPTARPYTLPCRYPTSVSPARTLCFWGRGVYCESGPV